MMVKPIVYTAKPARGRSREEGLPEAGGNGVGHQNGKINDRPVIRLEAGALHQTATDAEKALLAAATPLYARGGEIVRPIVEEVAAFKGRRTKVVRLKPATADMLRDLLCRAARCEKYSARQRKFVATDPPYEVAKIILARDGEWSFQRLTGVVTTPTLRPDGSILSAPGYDAGTGLLLLAPPPMPEIPRRPSRADAMGALALLDDLLEEFPFVNDADRSVALSALITPVARGAMQVAPLHAVTAPMAGTGKCYVIDIASAIATGEVAPVIAAGRHEEETEKRLAAELMTGQPIISIDNLNGDLGGDFLCQAIERPIIKPRVLGLSETRRIENTVTLFGNGNNIRLSRRPGPPRYPLLARRQPGAARDAPVPSQPGRRRAVGARRLHRGGARHRARLPRRRMSRPARPAGIVRGLVAAGPLAAGLAGARRPARHR